MRGLLITALSVLVLSGCGGESTQDAQASETTTRSATASTSTTETPTPTPTPTATPTPTGADVELGCDSKNGMKIYTGTPDDLDLFWTYNFSDCWDSTASGTPSAREQRALNASGYKKVKDLAYLYDICAENDKKWMDHIRTAGSPSQLRELRGALIICPDHPQRDKVAGFVKIAEANNQLVASGRVFYDGVYRVGQKVPAGTYYAEPGGDGCYWERTDSAGGIIDNSFSNGLRVEMTVYASDYSIKVEGCGEWRPVGQ